MCAHGKQEVSGGRVYSYRLLLANAVVVRVPAIRRGSLVKVPTTRRSAEEGEDDRLTGIKVQKSGWFLAILLKIETHGGAGRMYRDTRSGRAHVWFGLFVFHRYRSTPLSVNFFCYGCGKAHEADAEILGLL